MGRVLGGERAITAAKGSSSKFRLGACVVTVDGNRYWTGTNYMERTHPMGLYLLEGGWVQVGVHAEMSALIAARGNTDSSVLFVARLLRNDKLAMARPCCRCRYLIKKAGVSIVWYTTGVDTPSYAAPSSNWQLYVKGSSVFRAGWTKEYVSDWEY